MAEAAASEPLGRSRQEAAWVETLRGDCEPEHHWRHRREFLLRNAGGPPAGDSGVLQRLVSLSMVWANHVFLGCRYPLSVMEKVLEMAEGIKVTDAPAHTTRDELVAKVKKRGISSSNEGVEEPCKKRAVDKSRDSKDVGNDAKLTKTEVSKETESMLPKKEEKDAGKDSERSLPSSSSNQEKSTVPGTETETKAANYETTAKHNSAAASASSGTESKMNYHSSMETKHEKKSTLPGVPPAATKSSSQASTPAVAATKSGSQASAAAAVPAAAKSSSQASAPAAAKSSSMASAPAAAAKSSSLASAPPAAAATRSSSLASVLLVASKSSSQATAAPVASKSSSQASENPAKVSWKPLTSEDAKERQPFFNRLYKAVAWKLVAVGGFSPNVNHAELLNSSIQSVKATLDVTFVPLKELADLPQNKSSHENIVCELRCKSVYLGTGCGKSKENAKAIASREALKLFLKKKVIVKICKRKYKGREIEDLVLLDEESKPSNLPPALRNPQEIL
ncbi:CDKN2A-interacting protein isoform X11 [Dermochelys coriacea]|uniref:CDKN2A-interacting protein isoform X11 n=1 Tax=Dermochelys coriacea TaxID=27794 RepID=UPI001CA83F61|nr:CDKN2A-interacting protein isoform X11 [Dermochelys coriacea]